MRWFCQVRPMSECESCQVGNEAALSNLRYVCYHLVFFCLSAVNLYVMGITRGLNLIMPDKRSFDEKADI